MKNALPAHFFVTPFHEISQVRSAFRHYRSAKRRSLRFANLAMHASSEADAKHSAQEAHAARNKALSFVHLRAA